MKITVKGASVIYLYMILILKFLYQKQMLNFVFVGVWKKNCTIFSEFISLAIFFTAHPHL
jgi:hypothetical protein